MPYASGFCECLETREREERETVYCFCSFSQGSPSVMIHSYPISSNLSVLRYAIQFCKMIDTDNYARINLEDVGAAEEDEDDEYDLMD